MKKRMCEVGGCNKVATRKVKNGHQVCEDCMKKLRHNHKIFGHNTFYKDLHIGTIGDKYGVFVGIGIRYV